MEAVLLLFSKKEEKEGFVLNFFLFLSAYTIHEFVIIITSSI